MKHYYLLFGALSLLFLASFGLVESLDLPLLADPSPWMKGNLLIAACIGIGLLAADIFLPIPATIVMITHGALFGVLTGTFVSLIGSFLSAWLGFYLGRRGGPLLTKWIPEHERLQADRLLQKYGTPAVIVSRPVPILSESIAIMAGTGKMGWAPFTLAVFLGALPASFLYAFTGATAMRFDSMVLVFGLVLLIAGFFWMAGRSPREKGAEQEV